MLSTSDFLTEMDRASADRFFSVSNNDSEILDFFRAPEEEEKKAS